MAKAIIISLLVGAFATTTAEYFFHYNLLDYTLDLLKKLVKLV